MNTPPFFSAEMQTGLNTIIQPDQVFELRLHGITSKSNRRTWNIANGYFQSVDAAVTALDEFCKTHEFNTAYYTPNPLTPAILARRPNLIEVVHTQEVGVGAADADVLKRNWFLIDLDYDHPAGISSSDDEVAKTLAAAKAFFALMKPQFGEPVVISSGNGTHLMYRIDLPTDDGGVLKMCLKQAKFVLETRFPGVIVDQKVFNPARIWKLPGSVAKKGHELPEQKRFHRQSHMVYIPKQIEVVDAAELEKFCAPAIARDKKEAESKKPVATTYANRGQKFPGSFNIDLRQYLAEHGIGVRFEKPWNDGTMFILNACPWNPQHTNGSAFALQGLDGALSAGCHHNSCQGNGWHELRDICEPGWRDKYKGTPEFGMSCSMESKRMMLRRIIREEIQLLREWVRWQGQNPS